MSLFHPAATDAVDWQRGNYSLTTRGGRVESESGWGQMKKNTRMVAEGSVLVSAARAARGRSRRCARWLRASRLSRRLRAVAAGAAEGARMKYRVTCLTPTLVGDGQKLAPIDYMVWKDHVNVLDQRRIFRLLAKGPRLEGYLAQLKKADKLDFASWGGFAQNFAGRRLPFEHASSIPFYERAHCGGFIHPDLRHQRQRPLPARHRAQRSAPHRFRLRPLDRKHRARTGRARRRPRPALLREHTPKTPC